MGEAKSPSKWLHTSETAEFLATCLNAVPGGILESRPDPHRGSSTVIRRWAGTIIKECEKQGMLTGIAGKGGGTFAHWQIATAYGAQRGAEIKTWPSMN